MAYAFNQLTQPIFQQLDAWMHANSEDLTLNKFFKEVEHYMGILMLTAKTKTKYELNTIVMRSNKLVNKYYHRLFKLWKDANTSMNERMEKFKFMLKPIISQMLLARKYNSLRKLLAAAKSVKEQKKKSIAIFHKILNHHRNLSSHGPIKPMETLLLHQAR